MSVVAEWPYTDRRFQKRYGSLHMVPCASCNGSGEARPCFECGGGGWLETHTGYSVREDIYECPSCRGSTECQTCDGWTLVEHDDPDCAICKEPV